jgi:hypothetical protein
MRDVNTKPKKFRELVREISILMAYEATADIQLKDAVVTTPMGTANGYDLGEKVGLVPVLRAGLGMVEGVWEMMPAAEEKIRLAERDETLERIAAELGVPAERGKRFAELTSLRVGGAIVGIPLETKRSAAIVEEPRRLVSADCQIRSNVLADDNITTTQRSDE